jgi:hypothetical protein
MTREVRKGDELCALHITHEAVGTTPVSDSSWPLQMLMIERKAGSVFPAHMHKYVARNTEKLQEALVVLSGCIRVTLYTREGAQVETLTVHKGECVFLIQGGWGIEVLEDARMYEFKNGPHYDDKVML